MKIVRILPLMFVPFTYANNDILLEFKTAYFFPTSSCVRSIFGNGGALFGPEVTFNICDDEHWYGFASVDFFNKKGRSVGLCDRTKMQLIPLAIGAKYFMPSQCSDMYFGLGVQALRLKTINCSSFVTQCITKWGFGIIAKLGVYYDLPCDWFLDFFIDYSVARFSRDVCCNGVVPLKVNLDGALFGAGLGYRF